MNNTQRPEYGVNDEDLYILEDAVATYGLRVIHNSNTHHYHTVPDRVDFKALSKEVEDEFKGVLNEHLLAVFNIKYVHASRTGPLNKMGDLVKLVDWGRYKGYARRRTGYSLVSFVMTDDRFDLEAAASDQQMVSLHKRFL